MSVFGGHLITDISQLSGHVLDQAICEFYQARELLVPLCHFLLETSNCDLIIEYEIIQVHDFTLPLQAYIPQTFILFPIAALMGFENLKLFLHHSPVNMEVLECPISFYSETILVGCKGLRLFEYFGKISDSSFKPFFIYFGSLRVCFQILFQSQHSFQAISSC